MVTRILFVKGAKGDTIFLKITNNIEGKRERGKERRAEKKGVGRRGKRGGSSNEGLFGWYASSILLQ